jgi:hypothetical protein
MGECKYWLFVKLLLFLMKHDRLLACDHEIRSSEASETSGGTCNA